MAKKLQNKKTLADKMGAYLKTKTVYCALWMAQEEFQLFFMANMLLIGRFDFFSQLMDKIGE